MAKIPLRNLEGESKVLGSSFQAEIFPLKDPADFKAEYEAFRKRHPKADHYPYAYRLGGITKSSDDGEPGSTAGVPLLTLLERNDIEGAVVVARYFGGTKLGIPRLRRAFLSAAEDAIGRGGLGEIVTKKAYRLEVDYSTYHTLENNAARYGYSLKDVVFDVNVKLILLSGASIDEPWEKMGLPIRELPVPETQDCVEEIRQ